MYTYFLQVLNEVKWKLNLDTRFAKGNVKYD